jgi:hypothetical protein
MLAVAMTRSLGIALSTEDAQRLHEKLQEIASQLVLQEREACAEICKKQADVYGMLEPTPAFQAAWAACIDNRDRILARGQQ